VSVWPSSTTWRSTFFWSASATSSLLSASYEGMRSHWLDGTKQQSANIMIKYTYGHYSVTCSVDYGNRDPVWKLKLLQRKFSLLAHLLGRRGQ
jgi:hypothetical protein